MYLLLLYVVFRYHRYGQAYRHENVKLITKVKLPTNKPFLKYLRCVRYTHLLERGYPENFIQTALSEVTFEDRNQALRQTKKQNKKILPFVTQYHPAVPNLKPILMNSWHFITQQPLLNNIFKEPPPISPRD